MQSYAKLSFLPVEKATICNDMHRSETLVIKTTNFNGYYHSSENAFKPPSQPRRAMFRLWLVSNYT